MKNKFNGCTSKYLFTTETLNNIKCPKERIMINWERTESLFDDFNTNKNKNINNKDIISSKNQISFLGCINQSCCLQIYYNIKNKFDLLFILSIYHICFYVVIFFLCFYFNCNIDNNLDEEISEKINMLCLGIITLLVLLILLPFISTLPSESNQSLLNLIKNNQVSESLSIIPKESVNINLDNLFKATNKTFNEIKDKIIKEFKYNLVYEYLNNSNFGYKLAFYEYDFKTEGLDILLNNNNLKKISFNNFENNFFPNSTEIIKFRTKSNIINNLFEFFEFIPRNPLKNDILLNIEINAIYSPKNKYDKIDEINNLTNGYKDIFISESDIFNNYDQRQNYSFIHIIKEEIDFSIMNKTNLFYIKGNIINDTGNSIINIYNYLYSAEPIYSTKTEPNGSFIVGPIYKIINYSSPYYLNLEISKLDNVNDILDINSYLYSYDENFCKFFDLIKIDEYSFQLQNFYSIKNIILPEYKKGNMKIYGNVRQFNEEEDEKYLSYVDVQLFYGKQINKILELIELEQNNLGANSFNEFYIDKTSTNKEGEYYLNIYSTGQYMLLFIKEDYYLEKKIFTIDEISQDETIFFGTAQLIKLFNSGTIVVKLSWDLKPPDLDLFSRFQVSKNYYCYTFFGNKKCAKTEFFFDNKNPEKISSEIIEIKELSDYIYFFYVRKYFDHSNGETQNEFKIEGVEDDNEINKTEIYKLYDNNLNDTSANIFIYSNGYKIPSIKIPMPDYEINKDNLNKEYIYWAAFCINGKEGINSMKIINKYYENEPEKNICLSYYDEDKIIKF